MSEPTGNSSVTNGTGTVADPMQRLSSFKTPRDLSLGGVKPNKKVFTPNLNVSRNKSKSALPVVTRDHRKDEKDKGRRDRKIDKNKNLRNGPNIIKASGVFSEGIGAAERHTSRGSYGRDVDAAAPLQKPTIRVKDVWKIDKELEDQKISKVFGDAPPSDDEQYDTRKDDKDAPIKLPMCDGSWLHSKPKIAIKPKPEVVVKREPADDTDTTLSENKVEVSKESLDNTDIVSLLRSDKPALIMLQLPDSLPGRPPEDEEASRRSQRDSNAGSSQTESTTSRVETEEQEVSNKCLLAQLQEGRIGKLLIHRSGRVRLSLGNTMFEVSAGTPLSFSQQAVSVAVDDATNSANLLALGALTHKMTVLPDWESILADCKI